MSLGVTVTEKLLLHYFLDHPQDLYLLPENMFISPAAQSLFDTYLELNHQGMEFSDEHLIAVGNPQNELITDKLISELRLMEYDPTKIDFYLKKLRKSFARESMLETTLPTMMEMISSKKDFQVEDIDKLRGDLVNTISLIEEDTNSLVSTRQMVTAYESHLNDRLKGLHAYSSGCSHLDKHLTVGFAPTFITTIFGATGSGKSTYILNLVNRMLNKNIPCMMISTEMDLYSSMDRLIALRTKMPITEFYPNDIYPQEQGLLKPKPGLDDIVMDRVRREAEILQKIQKFFFVDKPGLLLPEIKHLIEEGKRRMGVDSLTVFIDLLSMIPGFTGEPSMIEDSMNRLHYMAKELNVHLVVSVQANRGVDNSTVRAISQLSRYRPTLNGIKNSAAYAERSRLVLSTFRLKYYALKEFPEDPELDIMDDELEIAILKQSQGAPGGIIRYMFNGAKFQCVPYLGKGYLANRREIEEASEKEEE